MPAHIAPGCDLSPGAPRFLLLTQSRSDMVRSSTSVLFTPFGTTVRHRLPHFRREAATYHSGGSIESVGSTSVSAIFLVLLAPRWRRGRAAPHCSRRAACAASSAGCAPARGRARGAGPAQGGSGGSDGAARAHRRLREEIRAAVAEALAEERERELAEARAFWAAQEARGRRALLAGHGTEYEVAPDIAGLDATLFDAMLDGRATTASCGDLHELPAATCPAPASCRGRGRRPTRCWTRAAYRPAAGSGSGARPRAARGRGRARGTGSGRRTAPAPLAPRLRARRRTGHRGPAPVERPDRHRSRADRRAGSPSWPRPAPRSPTSGRARWAPWTSTSSRTAPRCA